MLNYGEKNYLIKQGFEEVKPWHEFKHKNGLLFSCDDHEWSLTDENDAWLESGSLNDLSIAYEIIEEYHSK